LQKYTPEYRAQLNEDVNNLILKVSTTAVTGGAKAGLLAPEVLNQKDPAFISE